VSIPALLDFLLKLPFAEHVSSVSLCHLSSLPQLSVRIRLQYSKSPSKEAQPLQTGVYTHNQIVGEMAILRQLR